MDIFQIDWIYVDTIIIVLLFIALILMRFFKEISRWRWSSKITQLRKLKIIPSNINLVKTQLEIKKVELIKEQNKSGISVENEVNVIILNTHSTIRKRISKLMIEGLAARGYNVIYLNLRNFPDKKDTHTIKQYQVECKMLLSRIMEFLTHKDYISTQDYYTLLFRESIINHFFFLNNNSNKKLISINPKIHNEHRLTKYQDFYIDANLNDKLRLIFSRFSITFIKNPNIKKLFSLNKNLNTNISPIIIQKSRSSFNNYETILLEKLIYSIDHLQTQYT
ncbi:MAG: hypothetical protein GF317_10005 [Candidatus Lokiarchaeota archaeon]|nr:hypothetical protein [Candidatus Lokiarchaeota archaeon]MBD3200009.1 hypothetical protein [Candidatus Lokiarchaeota archaeon]